MVDEGDDWDRHRHQNFLVLSTGAMILTVLGLAFSEMGLTMTADLGMTLALGWLVLAFAHWHPIHSYIESGLERVVEFGRRGAGDA